MAVTVIFWKTRTDPTGYRHSNQICFAYQNDFIHIISDAHHIATYDEMQHGGCRHFQLSLESRVSSVTVTRNK